MTMPTNTPFSLRLDTKVKSRLKSEAKHLQRSESSIAAMAIRKYLDASEQKRHAIDEAVSCSHEGQFISSAAMGEWVDSWGAKNEKDMPVANLSNKSK